VQFNPENPEHKQIFKPYSYSTVEVFHNGELLMTGTFLNNSFLSASKKSLIPISGYSVPGILEDCEIPVSSYPLQSINLNLKQIAEKLIKPFGIKMIVDPLVEDKMNRTFKSSTGENLLIAVYMVGMVNGIYVAFGCSDLFNSFTVSYKYSIPCQSSPSTKRVSISDGRK